MSRVQDLLSASNVRWVDLDHTRPEDVFASSKFDIIIHCATNYGRGETDILDIVSANLMLPLQLLQLGIKHGVKTFVNTDTVIDKRVNYYSLSKKQFLDWMMASTEKIQCVNLALEHFYGPFDDISKFTAMIFSKLARNEACIDLTPGEQRRHFIHVDDVVSAFACVLNSLDDLPKEFSSFDVSSEESISICDFVLLAKKLSGNTITTLNFGAIPYRVNELMDSKTDIAPLKALGWQPRIMLEEGIRKTLEMEYGI